MDLSLGQQQHQLRIARHRLPAGPRGPTAASSRPTRPRTLKHAQPAPPGVPAPASRGLQPRDRQKTLLHMMRKCVSTASGKPRQRTSTGARVVTLDAVYRDFGTGYAPRWHADIIDPEAFYITPPRHTLLVAVDERDGTVAATAALDARGPAHPPNPRWPGKRYPSGETAQLRRVYVRPEHRRRGLARQLVEGLLELRRRTADTGTPISLRIRTHPARWACGRPWARFCPR